MSDDKTPVSLPRTKQSTSLPSTSDLKPWPPRRRKVNLVQVGDEWYLKSRNGVPFYKATDFEYSLWMDREELREEVRKLKIETRKMQVEVRRLQRKIEVK